MYIEIWIEISMDRNIYAQKDLWIDISTDRYINGEIYLWVISRI
jgi:hypothetical protein